MRCTMREGSVMSWKPRKCVIGGTVLVAAGVFLDQKKRREQM